MFNVCLCGAQSGFTHRADCPFPMYREFPPARVMRWADEREKIRQEIAAAETATARSLDVSFFAANPTDMCSDL